MTDPRTLARMADPRALAHEILKQEAIPPLCTRQSPVVRHSRTCDLITDALRTARKEALNEAAKVMDDLGVARQNLGGTTDLNMHAARQFFIGAAAIRKLGEE